MVIFNSYVKLPEGSCFESSAENQHVHLHISLQPMFYPLTNLQQHLAPVVRLAIAILGSLLPIALL
jgi:hypothetical protein